MTTAEHSAMQANGWFRQALGLGHEDTPFPWQEELLALSVTGRANHGASLTLGSKDLEHPEVAKRLDLLLLAPDIQEQIPFTEVPPGRDPVAEHDLR